MIHHLAADRIVVLNDNVKGGQRFLFHCVMPILLEGNVPKPTHTLVNKP
jgi:hypothetical protein